MSQNRPSLTNNNNPPIIQPNSNVKTPVQNVSNNNNQNIKSNISNKTPPNLNQLNSQYKYS